ncbi:MAG: hypothetical protein FJ225_05625 [Lentisphaerae bacterium]|nr:hypothetical protein [Lentisphaerota bacterium]
MTELTSRERMLRAFVQQHGVPLAVLGPRGLILSPIDNITVDEPRTWRNVETFVDEWKGCPCRPAGM